MSIAVAMILFGSLLVRAGWKNESVGALARGQTGVPKPAVTAGGAS